MQILLSPKVVVSFVIFLSATIVNAQQDINTVILYNSEPVNAVISSNGEVKELGEKNPNYLNGFRLAVWDLERFYADIEKNKPKYEGGSQEVIRNTVETFSKSIRFNKRSTVLDDIAILEMNEVLNFYHKSEDDYIVLRTLNQAQDNDLTRIRMESIKSYFIIRGINEQNILLEPLVSEGLETDDVKITFRKIVR